MSSEIYKSKNIHFPNLDGLRFLAFFVVFINHVVATMGHKTTNEFISKIKTEYLLNGDLGVNFFFVLSGFLITFLLIREKEDTQTISLKSFYARRILRIWPLYFLVLFIGLKIVPLFTTALPAGFPVLTYTHVLDPNYYIFFFGNFDYLKNGISNAIVGILWSVSVEEQFYLFWPLLLLMVPVKHLSKVFVVLIGFSIYYRLYGMGGRSQNLMQHYHTFSCLSDLATGAMFAWLARSQKFLDFFKKMNPFVIALIYIIGFGLIAMRMEFFRWEPTQNEFLQKIQFNGIGEVPRPQQYWRSFMPVVYSMFFGFVLMEQIFSERSIFKIGKIKLFSALGKISFGLYCYHMVAIFIVVYVAGLLGFNATAPDKYLVITEALIALGLTILISWLSYNYFEKFFLNLKHKLSAPKEKVAVKIEPKKEFKRKK